MTIKFGVQASQAGVSWDELLSLWQELDSDSNFDHLWLMDHFVTGAGTAMDSQGPAMEGWTAALSSYPQTALRNDRRATLEGLTMTLPEGLAFEVQAHRDTVNDPQMAEWLKRYAAGERPPPRSLS